MDEIRFPEDMEKSRTSNLSAYYNEIMQCTLCRKMYGFDEWEERRFDRRKRVNKPGTCPRCSLRGKTGSKREEMLLEQLKMRNSRGNHG